MKVLILNSFIILSFIICTSVFISAQKPISSSEDAVEKYIYSFDQPQFQISHIEIELQSNGIGSVTLKELKEDKPTKVNIVLKSEVLTNLKKWLLELNFINSSDTYQTLSTHANLGTTRITVLKDNKSRLLEFNYTSNPVLQKVVKFFRGIAIQQKWLADLEISRRYRPLDIPKQLINFEDDLKAHRITDPSALLPLLIKLGEDDHIPLIAKNQAKKLTGIIKKI